MSEETSDKILNEIRRKYDGNDFILHGTETPTDVSWQEEVTVSHIILRFKCFKSIYSIFLYIMSLTIFNDSKRDNNVLISLCSLFFDLILSVIIIIETEL